VSVCLSIVSSALTLCDFSVSYMTFFCVDSSSLCLAKDEGGEGTEAGECLFFFVNW
jgi:hypothetical protein